MLLHRHNKNSTITPQQLTPKPPLLRLDNNGDLTLLIGPNESPFLVSSSKLSQAGPIFKSIISSSSASRPESSTEPWIIRLPDDDADAAMIPLSIIHSRYGGIPSYLPQSEMRVIAGFAEKYGMPNLLRPWARTWVASLDASFKRPSRRPSPPQVRRGGEAKGKGGSGKGKEVDYWGFRNRLRRLLRGEITR
ncbi:hypothetical protein B0T16DRAFT_227931 [Cercophora newfieldiana]|uniref:BTB domain-containing protein n=1 Tax=Cercophora newfieldiana TaxID=92897 RepID=A0AA40CH39_9PEZI|nr:hypothetical protein B0T16DRAFT_227931 [Cercophora newfieldiana]